MCTPRRGRLGRQCLHRAPLALCGPVARIRAAELADSQIEVLGDDIPMALDRLRPLIRQH